MFRLVLCAGICVCSTLAALELHRRKERSAAVSWELSDKIAEIMAALRFEAADVYELCQRVFAGDSFSDYSAFRAIDSGDFPKKWQAACATLRTDTRSEAAFLRVGKILGSCDLQSQTELLGAVMTELREHAKAERMRAEASKKLYTTLGALLGAAVSIMII